MLKKILTILIFIITAGGLTFGVFAYVDKDIYIPYLEKKPKEVLTLMMNKMNEIKTLEYGGNLNMNIHIDIKNTDFDFSKTNEVITALNQKQPLALGIDNFSINNEGTNESPPLIKSSSMPLLGENKNDIKLQYNISGKIDYSDQENEKNETNLDMNVELGSTIFKASVESKIINDAIYIKLKELPLPISEFLSDFIDQWLEIDMEEIEKKQREYLKNFEKIEDNEFNYTEYKKNQKQFEKEISELFKSSNIIKIDERFKDKKIDNEKYYHYKLSVNRDNIGKFLEDVINIYNNHLNEINPVIYKGLNNREEFKDIVDKISNIIAKAEGEIWINKKKYYLKQSKFMLKLDFSEIDINKKKPLNDSYIDIYGDIKYFNFNNPISIEAPEDTEPLWDIIEKQIILPLRDARSAARDAKRISDIKQIQTALALYYNEKEKYPDKIIAGESIKSDNNIYLEMMPKNPEPGGMEYKYVPVNNGKDYNIMFLLESDTFYLKSGLIYCATQEGINGKCIASDILIDFDEDWIINGAEFSQYGTDLNDSDTDDDGFLDGEEIKSGYNPLGPGELNAYNLFNVNPDLDEDGISNIDEINIYNTDPENSDSNSNGINDGAEIYKEFKMGVISSDTSKYLEYKKNIEKYGLVNLSDELEKYSIYNYNPYLNFPPLIKMYIKNSSQLRQKKNYEKSLRELNEALKIAPDSGAVHFSLGLTYFGLENYQKALEHYEIALEDKSYKIPLIYNDLYVTNNKIGNKEKGIEYLKDGIEKFPEYLSYYSWLAEIYSSENKIELAEDYINKVLELEPRYSSAYNYLGLINDKKGNKKKAEEFYKKAIELDFHDAISHMNLSILYREDFGDAENSLIEALIANDIDPNYSHIKNALGLAYAENNFIDKAIEEYKKAIEMDPTYDKPYNNIGIAYSLTKDSNTAIQYYKKAIEISPGYARAYNNLGLEFFNMGLRNSFANNEHLDARPYFEKSIELNSNDSMAYYNLGRVYQVMAGEGEIKYYPDAEANFLKSIELKDNYFYTYRQLGFVYFNQGKEQEAIKEWEKAILLGMKDEEIEQIIKNIK